MAYRKHKIKGAEKQGVKFLNTSQSVVLLEYFKLSRLYGLSFGLILSLLGCAILVQLLLIASNDNYLAVIFSSGTFYIIKSAGWQAFLSTFFSLLVGILSARALHRRGNQWFVKFVLSTSFIALVVPTTVAALGIVAVWGRSGFMNSIGLTGFSLFGLWMVILAHVFFNAPLVLRVAYSALKSQPNYYWKIASHHNLTEVEIFKVIEWPTFKSFMVPLASLIFLLCFTSFSIVLMLGGGPDVTTLEVSIYHAVRFSFDMQLAASLSILQILICSGLILISKPLNFSLTSPAPNSENTIIRNDIENFFSRLTDFFCFLIFFMVILLPLVALFYRLDLSSGLILFGQNRFWNALYISTKLAFFSSILSVMIAIVLIHSRFRLNQSGSLISIQFIDISVSFYLLMPAIVFATGCFILLQDHVNLFEHTFWLVLLANVLFSLPFILRILSPSLEQALSQHDKLSLQLGITGLKKFIFLTFPSITRELQLVLGISFAFSLGDLSVITLFGNREFETLPYYLYQLFGRYGASEADILGIFILVYIFVAYFIFGVILMSFEKIHRFCRTVVHNATNK